MLSMAIPVQIGWLLHFTATPDLQSSENVYPKSRNGIASNFINTPTSLVSVDVGADRRLVCGGHKLVFIPFG